MLKLDILVAEVGIRYRLLTLGEGVKMRAEGNRDETEDRILGRAAQGMACLSPEASQRWRRVEIALNPRGIGTFEESELDETFYRSYARYGW